VKVRAAGRIVSRAVSVATGVDADGRGEVPGTDIGPSKVGSFRTAFLRKLARRGLRGAGLCVSDAHESIESEVSGVRDDPRQRCRVRFARNAPAHAGRRGRRVVSASVATAFARDDARGIRAQWCEVADPLRPEGPKPAVFRDKAEADGPACTTFPREHRAGIHSTNPVGRLVGGMGRRTGVVGIVPGDDAVARPVGAIHPEQTDERAVRGRCTSPEAMAQSSTIPASACPIREPDPSGPAAEAGDHAAVPPRPGTRSHRSRPARGEEEEDGGSGDGAGSAPSS